ncbi:MAG: hypothetical protein IPL39_02915 [Opitutaceae bacterium]|nr:hypothetical protein [Opitutaceae bacterium]
MKLRTAVEHESPVDPQVRREFPQARFPGIELVATDPRREGVAVESGQIQPTLDVDWPQIMSGTDRLIGLFGSNSSGRSHDECSVGSFSVPDDLDPLGRVLSLSPDPITAGWELDGSVFLMDHRHGLVSDVQAKAAGRLIEIYLGVLFDPVAMLGELAVGEDGVGEFLPYRWERWYGFDQNVSVAILFSHGAEECDGAGRRNS